MFDLTQAWRLNRRGMALTERVDPRQIAPPAVGVHAAPKHVAIGHRESHEIGPNRLGVVQRLLDQYRRQHPARPQRQTLFLDGEQGNALVQDVVHDEHGAAT